MEQNIIYVGLDVHKDTIAVALAEAGKRAEVREHGKIVNTPAALKTLWARLARNGAKLRFCYEAGPCGHGIQRQLSKVGHECVVVAPSLIPRKSGDRIKTERPSTSSGLIPLAMRLLGRIAIRNPDLRHMPGRPP